MKIIYLSLSGNVKNFVGRVGMDATELSYQNPLLHVREDFIVIVPTYDNEITNIINEFIEYDDNKNHLKGFVGSGNLNFDNDYCFNAKDLSKKHSKPLIMCFEISGTDDDVLKFKEEVEKIGITKINN